LEQIKIEKLPMSIKGKRMAILVEADYQDLEVHYPRLRLIEEGVEVQIIGTGSARRYVGKWGYPIDVDIDAGSADERTLDGIVIPGGWAPDRLRQSKEVLKLVREIDAEGKLIGCICHGGWVLSSAGIVKGRRLTSYSAIRDDLVNAGAKWVDREVVVDGHLITSRKPEDLPAFMRAIIRALKK
jgi:protease I